MSKYCYLLLSGIKPQNILAITFTKKAAKEMQERATKIQGDMMSMNWIGTFHAIALKILKTEENTKVLGLKPDLKVIEV